MCLKQAAFVSKPLYVISDGGYTQRRARACAGGPGCGLKRLYSSLGGRWNSRGAALTARPPQEPAQKNDLSENCAEVRPPINENGAWFVGVRATEAPLKKKVRPGAHRQSERERENLHRRSRESSSRSQPLRHSGIVIGIDVYRQDQKRAEYGGGGVDEPKPGRKTPL